MRKNVIFATKKGVFFIYCQSIIVVSVTTNLNSVPRPSEREARECIRWPEKKAIFDRFLGRFKSARVQPWRHIGLFWDHFWTKIGSVWGDFGPFLGRSGVVLGSLGIILASFWCHFGVVLTRFEAFWGPFWGVWGHFWTLLGPF